MRLEKEIQRLVEEAYPSKELTQPLHTMFLRLGYPINLYDRCVVEGQVTYLLTCDRGKGDFAPRKSPPSRILLVKVRGVPLELRWRTRVPAVHDIQLGDTLRVESTLYWERFFKSDGHTSCLVHPYLATWWNVTRGNGSGRTPPKPLMVKASAPMG